MLDANRFSAKTAAPIFPAYHVPMSQQCQPGLNDLFSDRKIQNAAYWKIANIELATTSPTNGLANTYRMYVSTCRHRTHTFTGYKGYNVDYAGGTFTPDITSVLILPHVPSCGVHFTF